MLKAIVPTKFFLSLWVFCVRMKKKKHKVPQGEMAYLLQTTSQGHSRREIKLQPASEGVT